MGNKTSYAVYHVSYVLADGRHIKGSFDEDVNLAIEFARSLNERHGSDLLYSKVFAVINIPGGSAFMKDISTYYRDSSAFSIGGSY